MKFTYSNPVKFFVRVVVIAFVCGLLLFSNTPSAFALWDNNPKQSEETLPNIQDKADQAINSSPYDLNQSSKKSNQGFNEIQGNADLDKMKHSDEKLPIVRDVEKALKNSHASAGSVIDAKLEQASNSVDSTFKKTGNAINSFKDDAGNNVDASFKKAGQAINSLTDKTGNSVDSMKSKAGKKLDDVKNQMKR